MPKLWPFGKNREAREPARAMLRIRGKVQGVFYRANTVRQAQARGLTGWVKNERDGSVTALVEGPRELIQELVEWCDDGPHDAEVQHVRVHWDHPTGDFDGFSVRRLKLED